MWKESNSTVHREDEKIQKTEDISINNGNLSFYTR